MMALLFTAKILDFVVLPGDEFKDDRHYHEISRGNSEGEWAVKIRRRVAQADYEGRKFTTEVQRRRVRNRRP
jgi:hypothetical protein